MHVRIRNLDFDTTPCVLHHNGGDSLCTYGLELKRRYFEWIGEPNRSFAFAKNGRLSGLRIYRRPHPRLPLEPIPQLSIVTFTSFRFPGSAELSLHRFGVPIEVIRPPGRWRNIRKLALFRQWLEDVTTDYVMFLDSHDTFVTSDIRGIVEAFEKLDCQMLFQADSNDWPSSEELSRWYDSTSAPAETFRYLCSGIFIGRTDFVRHAVELALRTPPLLPDDDQGVYKKIFCQLYPTARLDMHCELFQPLTDYHHARRPGLRPVEFRLQIEGRIQAPQKPGAAPLSARRLLAGLAYLAARRWDAIRNRWTRAGGPTRPPEIEVDPQ